MPNYFTALFQRAARRKALTEMMKLDDHMLRDIGLTRVDVSRMRSGRGAGSWHSHE
jgi:uncharacterized protein YjiS (DUF1127 family)